MCSAVCCAYAIVPRKNKLAGSRLLRKCWCIVGDAESLETCPVHVVGKLLESVAEGTFLFEGITAADALRVLRKILHEVHVEEAAIYRTHDFRRGHALDLQLSGGMCVACCVCFWCAHPVAARCASV